MYLEGATSICHYLDDYFSCGSATSDECQRNLDTMLSVCSDTGMKVNMSKVFGPSTTLEFLGIVIDSVKMELRMSVGRLGAVKDELLLWYNKHWGTKRQLLSLLGKLVFMCRIIKPGRIFMSCLFELSTKIKLLHHKVRLSVEAVKDVKWWLDFISQWNRKSVFYDEQWVTSAELCLATDASDLGHGAVCGSHWYFSEFDAEMVAYPIAWRELFAVATACSTWWKQFKGRKIILPCDNESVVNAVNSGKSRNKEMMVLVRTLFYICATHNFDLKLQHVPGAFNVAADMLSRLEIDKFTSTFVACDCAPTMPVFPPTINW